MTQAAGSAAPESSVIKTRSRRPSQSLGPLKLYGGRSHFGASLIMAAFLGGSGILAVLPELPIARHQALQSGSSTHSPTGGGTVVAASLGSGAESIFLDALKPTVADDLSQVEAMPETMTVTVRPGDTLGGLLTEAGTSPEEASAAVTALKDHYNPRRIRVGQDIELTLGPVGEAAAEGEEPDSRQLLGFTLQTDLVTHIAVARRHDGAFDAAVTHERLTEKPVRAAATIDSSLFIAAEDAGIPNSVTVNLIRLYSYDIDFQREIQKGDSFEVFYTQMVNEQGQVVDNGHILYAALTTGGETHRLWRYAANENDDPDYYDETGRSAKKFLMRTPIDGARLTSGFGMRRHPVLGYSKMHKGVDFGAPPGTPIMAAGTGTVEYAAPYGTFGNYVRIRHANGYKTAYAHMKGFARGIRKGAKVSQGQIIGYVGTTGRSTGPHLHYEVLLRDGQVNPMGIRVATGRQLEGKELAAYNAARGATLDAMASAEQLGQMTTAGLAAPSTTVRQ